MHDRLIHLELHDRNGGLLEALLDDGDLVRRRRQVEQRVGADAVADVGVGDTCREIGDRDLGTRYHGAARIGNVAGHGGGGSALAKALGRQNGENR